MASAAKTVEKGGAEIQADLDRIAELEKDCEYSQTSYEKAKDKASTAKKEYDADVAKLRSYIREMNAPSLFNADGEKEE